MILICNILVVAVVGTAEFVGIATLIGEHFG